MSIAVENLPIIFLGIVGLGVIIILIGIMKLANHQESDSLYTSMENKEASGNLEELFSFFLQEEEKKNQNFREMVMQVSHLSGDKETIKQKQTNTKKAFQEENTNKLPMEREVPPTEFIKASNFEVLEINLQQFERLVTSLPT